MTVPRATGQHTYRTEGIVLRGRDFGEADRLLTLVTPDHGKVRAIAKGVRRLTSKKAGYLEPFCRNTLLLAKGRDLDIIAQVEMLESFVQLRDTLDALLPAYYLAELVDAFVEEGTESRALYDAFVAALVALEHAGNPIAVSGWFELVVLTLNGLAPSWSTCAGCGAIIDPERDYIWSLDRGGVLCADCRTLDPIAQPIAISTIKVLRLLAREPLSRIVQVRLPTDALDDVRTILGRCVRAAVEHDLRSPYVLQRLDDSVVVVREDSDGIH